MLVAPPVRALGKAMVGAQHAVPLPRAVPPPDAAPQRPHAPVLASSDPCWLCRIGRVDDGAVPAWHAARLPHAVPDRHRAPTSGRRPSLCCRSFCKPRSLPASQNQTCWARSVGGGVVAEGTVGHGRGTACCAPTVCAVDCQRPRLLLRQPLPSAPQIANAPAYFFASPYRLRRRLPTPPPTSSPAPP